jgi:hypothetical protein
MCAVRCTAHFCSAPSEVFKKLPSVRITALPRPRVGPTNSIAAERLAAASRADTAPVPPKRLASPSNSVAQAAFRTVGGSEEGRGAGVAGIAARQWLISRAARLVDVAQVRGDGASTW